MRHLALLTLLLAALAARAQALTEDDLRWQANTGFNPQVHAAVEHSSDSEVFARVPYAYYPTTNTLEVAFDLAAAKKLLPPGTAVAGEVTAVRVRVLPATVTPEQRAAYAIFFAPPVTPPDPRTPIDAGTMPLDAKGRGYARFTLPALAAGDYQVEYTFGGATLNASRTFRRTGFPFEKNTLGTAHVVYAPFTPVQVEGAKVSVVDRTYTVNALGLFDSVVSKGRELLAKPMTLVGETADGAPIVWTPVRVKGEAKHPDLAVFTCTATSVIGTLTSTVSIEEDGCAKVEYTLQPAAAPVRVKSLRLEMALKDTEAPLCHLVGMNSMRHNYAGVVPRGGTVTWIEQPWRPARPQIADFPGMPPPSYQVWEAKQQMHWGSERWNFAPYVWLGAEERGLAWFGDTTQGYSTDGTTSLQRLFIEGNRVVLRVELIQRPVTLDTPRAFVFGLQASPTKPMPADWRGRRVPGGGGMSVVVWGGFNCADKVPANNDWSIVDKILEARGTGKADYAWLADYAKTHQYLGGGGGARPGTLKMSSLEDAKANGEPWLKSVNHFAGQVAGLAPGTGITVYFEEHQTSGMYPEVAEFMDEWSDSSFARYRYFEYPRTWGPEIRSAGAASYRDFAVYYANEWMRRGVGIYYDNTFPKVDRNRAHFADRNLTWSNSLWAHREYYRRVWKQSRALMAAGTSPMPLHIVGHITNCQVLPFTTWWDASLGVEQPGQWLPDTPPSAEAVKKSLDQWGFVIMPGPSKETPGQALPLPADYLRAMEMGRMAGLVPHYRHALRSEDAFGGLGIGFGSTDQGNDQAVRAHRCLSDAGMGLVHEIRGGDNSTPAVIALRRAMKEFGYGKPAVKVFNYWEETPFATVANPQVKWLAMTREGSTFTGFLLLQSYAPGAVTTTVRFPGGGVLVDVLSRERFVADGKGVATIPLDADYGTRALFVAASAKALSLLPTTPATRFIEDFELGLGPDAAVTGGSVVVIADPLVPDNHVLHLTPGHPAQNILVTKTAALEPTGDYTATYQFRLGAAPNGPGTQGLLRLGYRHLANKRYGFEIGLVADANGRVTFTAGEVRLVFDGGKSQPMQTTTVAPNGKKLGNPRLSLTDWHTVLIRVVGKHHVLALDGTIFFEGDDDTSLGGGLEIAPGWGLTSTSPVPTVDVDNIWITQTAGAAPLQVTDSWDDGHKNDVRLAALLRKYGAVGTFFIYPVNYVLYTKNPEAALKKDPFLITPHDAFVQAYAGMEMAAHGFEHPDMRKLTPEALAFQLTESKRVLEGWFNTPVVGMAYPGGAYNADVEAAVKKAGYLYARTVETAPCVFPAPDPYAVKVNVHHQHAGFWTACEEARAAGGVFYFWGHSYELKTEDDWRRLEYLVARLSADPTVQWVTNGTLFAPRK
jgi:peptidoglycan/xylan/chitin deacetylase (PgdA/CDA1 family)